MTMKLHGTTILTVRHQGTVAMGGDGQVTLGDSVMKSDATKIRRLSGGSVLCGSAGTTADAFALLERFEGHLKDHPAHKLGENLCSMKTREEIVFSHRLRTDCLDTGFAPKRTSLPPKH